MKFTNLRVANRLAVAFGLVFVLLLGISLASGLLLRKINNNVEEYATNIVPSFDNVSGILEATGTLRRIEAFYILADEEKERLAFEKRIADERQRLTGLVDNYKQYIVDDQDRRNWEAVRTGVNTYLATWEELRSLTQQGLNDPKMMSAAADMLRFGKSKDAFTAVQKSIQSLSDYNKELSRTMHTQSKRAYNMAMTVLVVCSVLALVLGFVLSILVARSITNELGGEPQDASQLARAIANGDLSVRVHVQSGADNSMMASFQHMVQSLSKVVSEVRQNAESVATVSEQIAQGNHDLSQRTEEQASALEQTAASMEELGSTARMNADNVKQVNQLAEAATSVASKGGQVVGKVIHTMHGINEASRQIGDIINVIDGIAFQTNILALNAAVEAARAGEQGRGFAVVAGEVRSLAQRSAGAAKEIKDLINTSVARVEEGSQLVDQAGQTIAEVVTSVKHVTDLMAEINVAINEQTANVAQVSNAVGQMDKVTQQNAALVEESAAAAQNLKEQAQEMVQAVAVFKLA